MKETKKHTKHTALIKPVGGEYHHNEWALLGAPCGIINQFSKDLAKALNSRLKVGYIDASHAEVTLEHPYHIYYQDKIKYAHLETKTAFAQKQNKKQFSPLDVLLINGNHFVGDKQIVFINEKKKESLERKLDRISDLRILIVESDGQEIYDFIKPHITMNTEVFNLCDVGRVADIIMEDNAKQQAKLKGLVLAGGKSQRMGYDKGAINYHGKAQRDFEADLIAPFCEEVYISISENQKEEIQSDYKLIKDTFTGLGPYGAILSAFREFPNQAWMTVACDLPLLNEESIKRLVSARNPSKLATCFHNPDTKFPEPLITIWEPRAYPVLLEFLSQGYSCPRKVLINTDIEEIKVDQVDFMQNVNDPEAYEMAKQKISKS